MTETNTDALMEILPGLLAPLLMTDAATDPARAHRAAQQAIEQYRAGTRGELVTIGQVVAFALIAIDNLRLSMPETVSMTMKLRLRSNANALNRESRNAVAALETARAAAGLPWAEAPDPEPIEMPVPEPPPVTPPIEMQDRHHWANAMATVASELRARANRVPSAQRKSDQLWVDVLANVAGELRHPKTAPGHPGLTKAELFHSTLMAGSGGLPARLATQASSRP